MKINSFLLQYLIIVRSISFVICVGMFLATSAESKVFTWQPAKREGAQEAGTPTYVMPEVTITGSIKWGAGSFDGSFGAIGWDLDLSYDEKYELRQAYIAMAAAAQNIGSNASVCKNRYVSEATRKTTSVDDATTRWLATQDVFNTLNLDPKAIEFYTDHVVPITLIIDSKSYKGFKVFYADGFSEVWVVNPGWRTSSFRVFDTPVPGSLMAPTNGNPICQPAG